MCTALHGIVGTPNDYAWSADNSAEVQRGWITRADSGPGLATASGGPRRDARTRVLASAATGGAPIPGLYACGAAGSIWGHLTEHGGGLTDAIVFGRIAGAEAAARARVAGAVNAPHP
jgi:succinate dehydrogenase/fumarate reductase flavoprotein subunit